MTPPPQNLSFWDHLDVLRGDLIRIIVAAFVMAAVAFGLKDFLFDVVLAPSRDDFFVYRWVGAEQFNIHLINTGLTEQMMIHLKVSLMAGILFASPYILYVLFHFISPALYENERRYSVRIAVAAYGMFLVGMAVCYVFLFPLTVRFLGTYQVSTEVDNMLTISSYVDTLLAMLLVFGIVFEIPVNGFHYADFKWRFRIPAEIFFNLGRVDSISPVMTETILDMLNEGLRNTLILQPIM